jgi:thiol-disulfide isomerase/thioredoxin
MKKKEKLKCPLCNIKFIPRTFYPEEATFSTTDSKLLSGFNGYISSSGVKPSEVILGSWVTYCPSCNYVMKFVKEIVKKEKIQSQNVVGKDIKEKYNNYYFGFPFEDYSQYLSQVSEKVKASIKKSLKGIDLNIWESMYEIEDTFKLLVRFYANLEKYCDAQFPDNIDEDLPAKIKLLKLSPDLENLLIELNDIRKKTIQGNYELSSHDKDRVNSAVVNFTLNLIEKHIKPVVDGKKLKIKFNYIDIKDLNYEIKAFLNGYLNGLFNHGKSANNQVRSFLDNLLIN